MMSVNRLRIQYLTLFLFTIIIGLSSRKTSLPNQVGDLLYACMAYWMFRFLFIKTLKHKVFLYTLLYCFFIEIMQLIQTPWLVAIRQHPFLKLILGQGFVWIDLVAYIIGAIIAFGIDKICFRKTTYIN